MKTLVFATNNPHKAREVEQILGPEFKILTLPEIGCMEDIPETEDTLEGNALLKAHFVKERYGYDCFSEDTGLEVDALGGAPGVHTARYAGEHKSAADNIALLLHNLDGKTNRRARFHTVIALILDGKEYLLEGFCPGCIAEAPRGEGGFGYDPVFIPDGHSLTFAQLDPAVKNTISHRAKAVGQLIRAVRKGEREKAR